ncbi:MAG TPA: hypothetical protein VFE14_12455 [Micromonosporaceae bacterium]|nr:hypothetical protein [Micromonosporaceae bacterium]
MSEAELRSRLAAPDLPDRLTLRFWPWMVMCVIGIVAFALLGMFAFYIASGNGSAVARVIAALVCAGMAVLALYTLASLRTRTILDRQGGTAISAFGRTRVTWSEIDRLDTVHVLAGWGVRAWSGDDKTIVYLCHDTHGRRPRAGMYDEPPLDAPRGFTEGYALVARYWRAARG